jgi:hypothetical protein
MLHTPAATLQALVELDLVERHLVEPLLELFRRDARARRERGDGGRQEDEERQTDQACGARVSAGATTTGECERTDVRDGVEPPAVRVVEHTALLEERHDDGREDEGGAVGEA